MPLHSRSQHSPARWLALLALVPLTAQADDGPLSLPADIVWVSISAALVFFMQAGFALLEGGSTRAKNATNVIMKNYADLCFGVLGFWLIGYGLMFGSNPSGWMGTDHFVMDSEGGSEATFFVFQAMFAATAATIVSGAVAERMRFWPYILGSVAITALIYPLYGSWVWGSFYDGSGWLAERGFVDFAGSTVVHSIGGWCALAAVIVLGPRLGRFAANGQPRAIPGHNLPLAALGVFVLWLGWFGFNGGSTLAASVDVGTVLMNTQLAAVAGVVGALFSMVVARKPIAVLTTLNGGLAGLVAITAGCASMHAGFAVLTGFVGGVVMVAGAALLERMQVDDVVGAVPVHGFAGAWGTLAAGLFYRGDLFNVDRVVTQLLGISVAFLWAFGLATLVFLVLKRVVGIRATTIHEQHGLDYTEHADIGYPEFQASLAPRRDA
ncbi:MAG: ammonium transporter [Oceanococcaceae bacterium]